MPGTRTDLAKAAEKSPQHEWVSNCHEAVLSWMIEAKYLEANTFRKLFPQNSNASPSHVFAPLLAQKERVVRQSEARNIQEGSIIGFWEGPTLQHSMVALGAGRFAGIRNGSVATLERQQKESVINHAIIKNDELAWKAGGQTVGIISNWEMYQDTPEVVAERIKAVVK